MKIMKHLQKAVHWFSPNRTVDAQTEFLLMIMWVALMIFAWISFGAKYLPTPSEVLGAFPGLWYDQGLGQELATSMALNLQAISIMFVMSYALAIFSVTPAGASLAKIVSLGRFNGFVGLPLIFMSILHNHHDTKVALLVFGMGVFTVLSLTKLFDSIPKDLFDHSRTLRMGEWRVVWEVVVLGTFDSVIDILLINIAMGWMMLPTIEYRFQNEGGIGALMEVQNKHLNLDSVLCALFVILLVGVTQDWLLRIFKNLSCPYASKGMERK